MKNIDELRKKENAIKKVLDDGVRKKLMKNYIAKAIMMFVLQDNLWVLLKMKIVIQIQ